MGVFKIDLIVWKSQQTMADEMYDCKFKIDLIVWKLNSFEPVNGSPRLV